MQEISKEFINQLLDIVNLNADSKVRSKSGYGRFSIREYYSHASNNESQVCMELWYKPTKIYIGMDDMLLRKCYDLTIDHLEVFQSVFYSEVIRFLTSDEKTAKLINYGKQI